MGPDVSPPVAQSEAKVQIEGAASSELLPPPWVIEQPPDFPLYYDWWKHAIERWLAFFLLFPAAPLILLLAALVKWASPGKAFYVQTRVGAGGQLFGLLKIRTMKPDAERETGPVWSGDNDDRVFWLGKFLRDFHLDELPQLINVVRGEMCLVGPRPERPELVAVLAKQIPDYLDRLPVKPGITGLAQVTYGADTDLMSVRRKLALDKLFMRSLSVTLDMRILLCTGLRFFGVSYALSRALTNLERVTAPIDRQFE